MQYKNAIRHVLLGVAYRGNFHSSLGSLLIAASYRLLIDNKECLALSMVCVECGVFVSAQASVLGILLTTFDPQ